MKCSIKVVLQPARLHFDAKAVKVVGLLLKINEQMLSRTFCRTIAIKSSSVIFFATRTPTVVFRQKLIKYLAWHLISLNYISDNLRSNSPYTVLEHFQVRGSGS